MAQLPVVNVTHAITIGQFHFARWSGEIEPNHRCIIISHNGMEMRLTLMEAKEMVEGLNFLGITPLTPAKPEGQCTCDVRDLMIRGCKCGVK